MQELCPKVSLLEDQRLFCQCRRSHPKQERKTQKINQTQSDKFPNLITFCVLVSGMFIVNLAREFKW